jgi:dihydrofolate reductase
MRRIIYSVAMSLDGFIAGPKGEADWIIMDPDIDFNALFDQFDAVLIGRRSFEAMTRGKKKAGAMPGMKTFVFSRTLRQEDYPKVTIVGENVEETLTALKAESGKDVWLFGGGLLFRSLLDLGLVDAVGVGVIPVLLGEGIPLLPSPASQAKLKLTSHKVYPKTGILGLEYEVLKSTSSQGRGKKSRTTKKESRR